MNETKYVAISTQKGGAGKTTLTVLVASYLHYVKGYNVAVVDCDFPQYSVHDMRKRDLLARNKFLYDTLLLVKFFCHSLLLTSARRAAPDAGPESRQRRQPCPLRSGC